MTGDIPVEVLRLANVKAGWYHLTLVFYCSAAIPPSIQGLQVEWRSTDQNFNIQFLLILPVIERYKVPQGAQTIVATHLHWLQPSGACTKGVYDGKCIRVAGYLTATPLSILQFYVSTYVVCHADEVAPEWGGYSWLQMNTKHTRYFFSRSVFSMPCP